MKRIVDLILTIPALLLLWPVLLIIAVLVRIKLGSPVFFRQTRPGKNGKPFQIIKFRTMRDANGSDGKPCPIANGSHLLVVFCVLPLLMNYLS
jgi:lipopolysaccharide/colanic/teichoic acid biosynthesis glycosyltransferase